MTRLTYKSLQHITNTQKPYRGTNRYPMDARTNNANCFTLEQDESGIYYRVFKGSRWDMLPITKEYYESMKNVQGSDVHEKDPTQTWIEHKYYKIVTSRVELCVVRPDNTVELTRSSLSQGENMKLTDWTNGYVHCDSRLGGVIYTQGSYSRRTHMFPLFEGLRFDFETLTPHESQNIRVFRRSINRRASKELMTKYKAGLQVSDVMMKVMDYQSFMTEAQEIAKDKWGDKFTMGTFSSNDCLNEGTLLLEQGDTFEAGVFLMLGCNLQEFSTWRLRNHDPVNNTNWYSRNVDMPELMAKFARVLPKHLYRSEMPFDEHEVKYGEVYPRSEWGIKVLCNDEEVEVY